MDKVIVLLLVGTVAIATGCEGEKSTNWKASDNPCSVAFKDSSQVVTELEAQIKADGLSMKDAGRLEQDAQLNEDNQLFDRANRLRCEAWLLRN